MNASRDIENLWAGKVVLVVDDYPSIRKTMRELCQSLGLNPREAENGLKALDSIRAEPPDLVITDLVMPEMDGFELTESIKNAPELRHIPLVVLSTHADSRYIFKALRLGADDYITKPATRDTLPRVLARIFDHDW